MSDDALLSVTQVMRTPDGATLVGVVTRVTYTVRAGRCETSPEQVALRTEPLLSDDGQQMLRDSDLLFNRAAADVIVEGHAYGFGAAEIDARVRIDAWHRAVRVYGERRAHRSYAGHAQLSAPEPFESVSLGWENAYGGVDLHAAETLIDPVRDLTEEMGERFDPRFGMFAYPRNPFGCGYLVHATPEALERLRAPNLEDPSARLTDRGLALEDPLRWPLRPPAASFGWLGYNVYPRASLLGLPPPPYDEALAPEDFFEVRAGDCPPSVARGDLGVPQRVDAGAAQCSALGMRVTDVRPDAAVQLEGLHPREPVWRFELPGEAPRVALQLPDEEPLSVQSRARTVLIEPDLDRVSLVWVAEHRTARQLSPRLAAKIRHAVVWKR